MRALFDYQAFEFQRIGGVSRSYAELIPRLRKNGCDCQVSVKESDNVYLASADLLPSILPLHYHYDHFMRGKKLFWGQRALTRAAFHLFGYSDGGRRFNQDYSIKILKRNRFDVFEPTYFDSYFLPYLKGKPFVMTVHDMIPELYPQYFARDDYQIVQKKKLCHLAAHIHVPSDTTKQDLITILNIPPERISVIPHGGPDIEDNDLITKRLFDFPYILYVGDRYGYKNFHLWLKTVAKVVNDYPEIHVVCTGKPFNDEEMKLIHELHLDQSVCHFFATKETFGSLYHNAITFVYPSDYEGFGLPILEAFAYGCPVMLNNASCFPEVGGDAVLFFNMRQGSSDFYDQFKYLYSMGKNERNQLIEKGKKRLQAYSWEKSARQLLDIYQRIV